MKNGKSLFSAAKARQQGFTLISMCVILSILGLMAGSAAYAYQVHTKSTYNATVKQRQTDIQNALVSYFKLKGHLPCPAEPGAAPTSVKYGSSIANGAVTTPGTCSYNSNNGALVTSTTASGAVLTRSNSVRGTLGYPDGAGARGFHNPGTPGNPYADCSAKARARASAIHECGWSSTDVNTAYQTLPTQCVSTPTGQACLCGGQALSNFATADGGNQNCVIGLMGNIPACKNKFMDPNYVDPTSTSAKTADFLNRCVISATIPCPNTTVHPHCANWLTAPESYVWIGAVPTRTLGLPDSDLAEPNGHLFIYAVTQQMTQNPTAGPALMLLADGTSVYPPDQNKGGVDVQTPADTISVMAGSGVAVGSGSTGSLLYTVINPGKDGCGVYTKAGIRGQACGAGAYESQNSFNPADVGVINATDLNNTPITTGADDAVFYGGSGSYSTN